MQLTVREHPERFHIAKRFAERHAVGKGDAEKRGGERIGKAAVAVFETVGLSVYARADFIVTEDGTPYFLEINTLPGMTPTSLVPQEAAAVGMDYGTLCETIIRSSLELRNKEL